MSLLNFQQLHLERLAELEHLEAVRATAAAAQQWYTLEALLRAQGWVRITPQTVAALCPRLPHATVEP